MTTAARSTLVAPWLAAPWLAALCLVAQAAIVGCEPGGEDGPQVGTPGLEPPHGLDGGAGPQPDGTGSGGSGSFGNPGSAASGSGGPRIPPTGSADAGAAELDADAAVDAPACEPVGETLDPLTWSQRGESCGTSATLESLIPNAYDATVVDLPLQAPLTPGQPFALTLSPPKSNTPGGIEIWGSEQACGPVDELLWYGDMEGRAQCVELMPTRPHSRLQFVSRMLDVLGSVFQGGPGQLVLCPSGSCPAGSDGHALEPGIVLSPPLGVYDLGCGSWFGGFECTVGAWGTMLLVRDSARNAERTIDFAPIASGAFRMPPNDPYGDAWYCVGAGSHTQDATDRNRQDVHLQGLTRLPACAGGSESASFAWMQGNTRTDITSSVAALAGLDRTIRSSCARDHCDFLFTDGSASSHLYVTLDGELSPSSAPAPVELSVLEAVWFTVPELETPVRRACSLSGTLSHDPEGSSTLQLDGLGAFVACPGEAIPDATLDLIGG